MGLSVKEMQARRRAIDVQLYNLRKERTSIWNYLFSDEAAEKEQRYIQRGRAQDPFRQENIRLEAIEKQMDALRRESRNLLNELSGYHPETGLYDYECFPVFSMSE